MPVFDFSGSSSETKEPVCTYEVFYSSQATPDPDHPVLVLDAAPGGLKHHTSGAFTNPSDRTSFEYKTEEGSAAADILKIDARFVSLLKWLGENRINVRLSGAETAKGYAVYKIREMAFGGGSKLSAEDGIRLWARRNLAVARSGEVSAEERRHAQHALSIMLNIQWKSNYFQSIDPDEARRILDEELYGMEQVKQRIIETIIQINRTHTLPSYGLLLIGPAGTGKSQIAYAVARILKMPWTTLDMSSINDPEQLTGSSRIYANAKPGIIMDAFSIAGESNLVFIINELDKAASGKGNGNPADVLLTLLDNLGFTDNYMECMIPTVGVYPIATANDRNQISAPLMSRFAVIEIPDYTPEEKKVIFSRYALPKVLRRIGMQDGECVLTPEGLDMVIELHRNTSGIRDLEQAAEHIAANALYQIEVNGETSVVYDAARVQRVLA